MSRLRSIGLLLAVSLLVTSAGTPSLAQADDVGTEFGRAPVIIDLGHALAPGLGSDDWQKPLSVPGSSEPRRILPGCLAIVPDRLLESPSAKAEAMVDDATRAIRDHEYGRATAVLDEAIRLCPWFGPSYHARGDARHMRSDYRGAIADYDQAIQLGIDSSHAYYNRGLALAKTGDYWAALDAFSDAIARFPERADIRAARAWVRLQLGDARSARFDAKWALDIDPTNAYAKQTWLKALDKAGEDATLRHALDEAISAEPEADLLVSRAVLLATSNDAEIRDPKAALADAIRADELTFGLSRSALRAKAAAQAALGDFPSAVGNSYRAMFREMPNRDGGTDVIRIVTYLARKPLARDVWDKDPPERNRRSFQVGVGGASTIGAYLEVDCSRAFWVRVALPLALPIPITIVRWNAQGMKEFCDELRTLIARGESARSKSQKGPTPEH